MYNITSIITCIIKIAMQQISKNLKSWQFVSLIDKNKSK